MCINTIDRIILRKRAILLIIVLAITSGAFAQVPQYGDLELTVLGNGIQPAPNIPVMAIDPELSDTNHAVTNTASMAFFEDLYIFTTVGVEENNAQGDKKFQGVVNFFSISGQLVDKQQANTNGSIVWNGNDYTTFKGIYLARGELGGTEKFFFNGRQVIIGVPEQNYNPVLKSILDSSNLYQLHADGRGLEWDPFDNYYEEHVLQANITNEVTIEPPITPDGPASGQVEILVDGEPAGNNSELKLVRTGQTDTSYFYTINGIADFTASSHPFGNFTRDYTMIINSFSADSNWFHAETHEVDIALGSGNDFVFTPTKISDAERTANVTLEILISGTTPASANAEVKVYRLGETDTTFAYTNDQGIAQLDRLVHPFQADAHQFAINSDGCASNFFNPLTEGHNLFVGQNDIEMNPDPVATNFAEGPARVWYGTALQPNAEVKIWRLNNTLDTSIYTTNAAGMIYYEDLPLEGSSSDYVFQTFKDASGPNPVLTSIDTFNLVTGINPMLNIYLEAISQFITMSGNIKEFYDQNVVVAGVGITVREPNSGPVIGSATTDANGDYLISGIPSGAETEVVMTALANHFHRIHAYTFHEVFIGPDTILPGMNMLHIPYDWIIPQTVNDPAPATVAVSEGHIAQLVGSDNKNAEEFIRNEKRMYLTNVITPADSAYPIALRTAIDSLFYEGQGSSIIFISNPVNINSNHVNNYNPSVGFPGELGWNVTVGGGNSTTQIHSSVPTGYFIIGGSVNITGGVNNLETGIKEWVARTEEMGDTDVPGMTYTGQTTIPNHTERAYHKASNINLNARVVTGNEIFPLNGLSTSTKGSSKSQ